MRQRVRGGYKYNRRGKDRALLPILVVACEGKTEEKYLNYLSRGRKIRIEPKTFKGRHGKLLVDDAIRHTAVIRARNLDPEIEVHTAVIFDLEKLTKQNIADAIEATTYGRTKGVHVWINTPVIERWFMLHLKHIGPMRSPSVVLTSLRSELSANKSPRYSKPGSVRFYAAITPLTHVAVANCSQSHIDETSTGNVPCLCVMFEFLDGFN